MDYNAKIEAIYITYDYNKFTNEILETKIKEKGLVNKSRISYRIKKSDLNTKLAALATKPELKADKINW